MDLSYPPETMPWWKSRVIVGAAISILLKLLVVAGLTGEFTDEESRQLVDLALILISAAGDVVAIGARVRQRYAPKITAGSGDGPGAGLMGGKACSFFLACLLVVPLMGCASFAASAGSPRSVAERTVLDEQAALTIALAYTGAARAAAVAIEAGLIDDPATLVKIGELDRQAFAAVELTEDAYRAGNAEDYSVALVLAKEAVQALLGATAGDRR
ncbi:hypothetical protein QQS45_13860 [Alteriqipengyuania flavescens]|uniref:hypothetical protein n=1 Tax=Alteriqipengyuania flavescens TaxID=3053610 RepID=UPI0025B5E101|nr:hypothetical protein [Alteriqipengyuania flavescens]WJY18667.1 hypothetical protein QQW98_13855 [Alteriqipengyuania flavescens]WJY24607.1 hypothetical protein QQS45_13860 [Alteriqipengyuania flavescens]